MQLASTFKKRAVPGTGRTALQLTSGSGFCYPLYYFIPSVTNDRKYLIHHRSDAGEVQLYRLNLASGESVQLTHATNPDTLWYPWCSPAGKGVLDHRSVLAENRNIVVYFDGNSARVVNIETLEDKLLFELPADRLANGQNCFSPDGAWFFYIHHDRAGYEEIYGSPAEYLEKKGRKLRHLSRETCLAGYNLDTQEHRTLIRLNSPIHHVHPYRSDSLLFSSLATETSMLLTDYNGGWYTHLRTQTVDSGTTCHYCASARGVLYEAGKGDNVVGGVVSPETRKFVEFPLPAGTRKVGAHVAFDPEGKRLIYERKTLDQKHDILMFIRHCPGALGEWTQIVGDWPCYGSGQKSHFHPRLVLDGNWMLITAGDERSQSNHIYLVDISDLPFTEGLMI